MKLSALRKQLSPGTQFTAELIGGNRYRCPEDMVTGERRVIKQSPQRMTCLCLTGTWTDQEIDLHWQYVEIEQLETGAIRLSIRTARGLSEKFLLISNIRTPVKE